MCPGHRGKLCSVNTEQSAAYCTVRRPPSHHHPRCSVSWPPAAPSGAAPRPPPWASVRPARPSWARPAPGSRRGRSTASTGRRWSKLVMYWSDERAMCQECCGELYPEVIMECWGVWQGYYVDTTCDIGQSPCYHHHHHLTVHIMPRSALPHHHPLHPGHLSSSAP